MISVNFFTQNIILTMQNTQNYIFQQMQKYFKGTDKQMN